MSAAHHESGSTLRETELIGLSDDGRMILWKTGAVQPISTFPTKGPWIVSDHYVIDWKGHAITVHCSNLSDGMIGVQFMCRRGYAVPMLRSEVEPILLSRVVPSDPARELAEERKLLEVLKELREMLITRHDQPHRQRGRIEAAGRWPPWEGEPPPPPKPLPWLDLPPAPPQPNPPRQKSREQQS